MTFEYLNCWNLIISRTKGDFKVTLKTFFLISQVLSFRHTKQTSKNVMCTTYCTIYSPLLIKTALTQPCKRKLMIKTFLIYHICPFSLCLNSIDSDHKHCSCPCNINVWGGGRRALPFSCIEIDLLGQCYAQINPAYNPNNKYIQCKQNFSCT